MNVVKHKVDTVQL